MQNWRSLHVKWRLVIQYSELWVWISWQWPEQGIPGKLENNYGCLNSRMQVRSERRWGWKRQINTIACEGLSWNFVVNMQDGSHPSKFFVQYFPDYLVTSIIGPYNERYSKEIQKAKARATVCALQLETRSWASPVHDVGFGQWLQV